MRKPQLCDRCRFPGEIDHFVAYVKHNEHICKDCAALAILAGEEVHTGSWEACRICDKKA